jgi:signal recognition particle subunit SEC65
LIRIKIKQTLITAQNRQIQKYKWDRQTDRQLLNQKGKINKYKENLELKLQEIEEETDINQDWQNLKQVILEAAGEFKLPKDAKNANHWWDDECERAIQEKNEARGKCLRKTRTNLEIYQQTRTNANRICRRKKKEWIEGKIK